MTTTATRPAGTTTSRTAGQDVQRTHPTVCGGCHTDAAAHYVAWRAMRGSVDTRAIGTDRAESDPVGITQSRGV